MTEKEKLVRLSGELKRLNSFLEGKIESLVRERYEYTRIVAFGRELSRRIDNVKRVLRETSQEEK